VVMWVGNAFDKSSLLGLFEENGPLMVERNGTGDNDFVLKARKNSWADDYNLVYVDVAGNTGFSHSTGNAKKM